MIQINKIHNIDCLEFMKKVPDNFFDLVLTDPPYGIGVDKSMARLSNKKSANSCAPKGVYKEYGWDLKIPDKIIFDEIIRVSKNQIIFGGNYFVEHLKNSSCWIVWDKDNGSNNFADCELAWTSFNTAVRKYKFTWNGMIQQDMKNKEVRIHPTQKPVKLFTALLQDYAKAGWKVFDPFMGSGTTALACKSLGIDWCGCELEHDYVELANERLKLVQQNMFGIGAE